MLFEIVCLTSDPFPTMVNGELKSPFLSEAAPGVPQWPVPSWAQGPHKRCISATSLLKFTPKLQYLNSLWLGIFSHLSLGHRCAAFYLNLSKRQTFQCRGKNTKMKKEEKSNHKIRVFIFPPTCEKQTTSFPAVTGKHSENFTKRSLFSFIKKREREEEKRKKKSKGI